MELYCLRHAIAIERGTPGYADSQRPLTPQGRRRMQHNAQGMQAMGLSFGLILSSPYLRAQETATIVAKTLAILSSKLVLTKNLLPDASFDDLVSEINARAPKIKNVLLVGHEPHLSELISFLLTDSGQMQMTFKKGGLCHLSAAKLSGPGCAVLQSLLTPSQLRLLEAASA